jgi:hypothetical protein
MGTSHRLEPVQWELCTGSRPDEGHRPDNEVGYAPDGTGKQLTVSWSAAAVPGAYWAWDTRGTLPR